MHNTIYHLVYGGPIIIIDSLQACVNMCSSEFPFGIVSLLKSEMMKKKPYILGLLRVEILQDQYAHFHVAMDKLKY